MPFDTTTPFGLPPSQVTGTHVADALLALPYTVPAP